MFEQLDTLPADPILGLIELYKQDSNPNKVDLGVGVYRDEQGQTPILDSVKAAQLQRCNSEETKSYIGPAGAEGFIHGMETLLFGRGHSVLRDKRVVTAQTPGGCGALRAAAELASLCKANTTIWVSDPTWGNHVPLLGDAGMSIREYPYYDYENHGIRFDAMVEALKQTNKGDMVLLHGCCHNPCGADLTPEQWRVVADIASARGFTPFIDIAYQGFSQGLDEDAYGVRLMADSVPELFVTSSCSKNFGLYRERVGAVVLLAADAAQANATRTQLFRVTRGIYSMPPAHGGAIVDVILNDNILYQQWVQELTVMRNRINDLRRAVVESFNRKGAAGRFDFISNEKGMFSFLGISKDQVQQLQKDFSIYLVDSSRINVAGVSQKNLDYLTDAVMSIL